MKGSVRMAVLSVSMLGLVACVSSGGTTAYQSPAQQYEETRLSNDDAYMARVVGSWSISSRCVQPAFIALGGVLATVVGMRGALWVAGICCTLSAVLLPWKAAKPAALPEPA